MLRWRGKGAADELGDLMGRLQPDSANREQTPTDASEHLDGAARTEAGAPTTPTAEVDPASLPAPVGDPTHPSLVLKHEFYHFRDEYQLRKEPSVDQSVASYLSEVEKAFQNRWNLHPNVILERTHKEKIKHAYDLDFRENEIKRIRSILPVDKDVFDYIDVLIDVVMLENLKIYVRKRFGAYRASVWWVRFCFLLLLAGVGYFLGAKLFTKLGKALANISQVSLSSLTHAAVLDLNTVVSLATAAPYAAPIVVIVLMIAAYAVWFVVVRQGLGRVKDDYEAGVRDATALAALKLANKGRDVNDLMQYLKNRLETISSPDKERVDQAPKLVRILLWCPERMLLIENYYRAKMDQFNVKSAMVSLRSLVTTKGIIYNRTIFMIVLAVVLAFGLGFAHRLGLGADNSTAAAGAPVVKLTSAAPSSSTTSTPVATTTEAARPPDAPIDPRRGQLLIVLAAVVGFLFLACGAILNRLGGTFALGEIRDEQTELVRNGLGFFLTAAFLGLAPTVAVFAYDDLGAIDVAIATGVLCAFLLVWFLIPVVLAQLLFQIREHIYSSNVLTAVIKKMASSQWTRYSDLRVDDRVAEVFSAIYNAWFRESSKGIYGGGGTHASTVAASERRHFKADNS